MDVGFAVAQWEWLLILLAVLGLAVFELVALRRSQRRDRERQDRTGS